MQQRTKPISLALLLVAGSLILVSLMAWPWLADAAHRLPGATEQATLALWHTWWTGFGWHTSDTLSFGLPFTLYSGAPYLSNRLAYLPVIQGPIFFSPLHALTGSPVLAFNLTLLLNAALTLLTSAIYFKSKGLPNWLAALGALAFSLSGWMLARAYQSDLIALSLWPLPLALLFWDRWLAAPRSLDLAALVISLYAGVLCGIQGFAWIFSMWLPYMLYTGIVRWQALRRAPDTSAERLSRAFGVGMLVFVVLLLIYPLPGIVRTLSGIEAPLGPATVSPAERSFIVLLTINAGAALLLAFAGLAVAPAQPRARVWGVLALINLAFALGIVPDFSRMLIGALWLPFQRSYTPDLLFAPATFALLMLAAMQFSEPFEKATLSTRAGGLIAALLLILGGAALSMRGVQTTHIVDYPVLRSFRPDPEDYLVLHYPFGTYSTLTGEGQGAHPELAVYAIWHEKRPLSIIAPLVDPRAEARFSTMSFLTLDITSDSPAELAEAVNTWRMGYVILHPDLLASSERATIESLIVDSEALCDPVERDGLILYRARWHPGGCEW